MENRCQFCNSKIQFNEEFLHGTCKEFTLFVLDEMIEKTRKKIEILLLKKKELIYSSSE
jgi:hypothetical protein